MALVGGAGNVSGSNPTGTGTSLNYIGDHAYATTGTIDSTTTAVTVLRFATANNYLVGNFFYAGAVNTAGSGTITQGEIGCMIIEFNSEVIINAKVDSGGENSPFSDTVPILIPPNTEVTVKHLADGASGTKLATIIFSGRSYA